ncbi:hypothetical protein BSKO_01050 [Bryopsis sp. KO-2023]|nr:hypothetical protein BSKO_01050 [Bryopsis sp. KO-2023]
MCRFPEAGPKRTQDRVFDRFALRESSKTSKGTQAGGKTARQSERDQRKELDEPLFDIELDCGAVQASGKEITLDDATRSALQNLSTPEDKFCSQLQSDVQKVLPIVKKTIEADAAFTIADLGKALCNRKYKVNIRSGLPLDKKTIFSTSFGFKPVSNTNPECLKVLRHSFLMVEQVVLGIRGKPLFSREVVVEPDFKLHFMVPVMTDRYKSVMSKLPDTFVGGRAQLKSLLVLMCEEMERVFKGNGRDVPPWRQFKSVWTKWAPKRYEVEDVVMDANHAIVKKRQDPVAKHASKKLASKCAEDMGSFSIKGFEATAIA